MPGRTGVRRVQSATIWSAGERCSTVTPVAANVRASTRSTPGNAHVGKAADLGVSRDSLGNFSMLAMLLNTFQVDLQPVEPPFSDVRGFGHVPAGQQPT